mmetsp:Transcript_47993/g.94748  ORF Transcript_47993/g.94748 Transcript_47993/m.94748 type:complete len:396 (-) Transcript_47993:2003-3190(-)
MTLCGPLRAPPDFVFEAPISLLPSLLSPPPSLSPSCLSAETRSWLSLSPWISLSLPSLEGWTEARTIVDGDRDGHREDNAVRRVSSFARSSYPPATTTLELWGKEDRLSQNEEASPPVPPTQIVTMRVCLPELSCPSLRRAAVFAASRGLSVPPSVITRTTGSVESDSPLPSWCTSDAMARAHSTHVPPGREANFDTAVLILVSSTSRPVNTAALPPKPIRPIMVFPSWAFASVARGTRSTSLVRNVLTAVREAAETAVDTSTATTRSRAVAHSAVVGHSPCPHCRDIRRSGDLSDGHCPLPFSSFSTSRTENDSPPPQAREQLDQSDHELSAQSASQLSWVHDASSSSAPHGIPPSPFSLFSTDLVRIFTPSPHSRLQVPQSPHGLISQSAGHS